MASATVNIYNNFYICLSDLEEAEQQLDAEREMLIPFARSTKTHDSDESMAAVLQHPCNFKKRSIFENSYLSAIFHFDAMVKRILNQHLLHKIIFCAGKDLEYQIELSILLGCHLIMTHGLGFEETFLAFRPLNSFFKQTSFLDISLENILRAFCCAKCLNWIDFGQKKDEQNHPICMEEFDRDAR